MIGIRLVSLVVCVLLLGVSQAAWAEGEAPGKAEQVKPARTAGTVTAVSSDSITVLPKAPAPKRGQEPVQPEAVTIPVNDMTQVRVDNKKATIADVKIGHIATVIALPGEAALKIDAQSPEEQARREEQRKQRAQEKAEQRQKEKAPGEEKPKAQDGEM